MKAKVINTGEIIYDAVEYEFDIDQYMVKGRTKDGELIKKWSRDVIMLPSDYQQEKIIDWEQRRYEIAKDIASALIARDGSVGYGDNERSAYVAVLVADLLVNKLKN